MLDAAALEVGPTHFKRVVVGVDPSGSAGQTGDLTGIVAVGLGQDGRAYVLEDASIQASPDGWAQAVSRIYHRRQADRVVAERNFGGEMVRSVLQAAAPNLPITLVTASRGKSVRAEPVSALYEQGRVSHVGPLPELEDQMCLMTGAGYEGQGSPDRLDALVWALTELMLSEMPSMGIFEFYREEAERAAGPELVASADLIPLRVRPGVSHVTGGLGETYVVRDGVVRVKVDDVVPLMAAGFERI
jgi:phage terminase large subunit-like protein